VKNCKGLAIGILNRAVKDYQYALRKGNTEKAERLERWFLSDWAQFLSDDMGEIIIEKSRNGVVKK
jgi:hypothetical protein